MKKTLIVLSGIFLFSFSNLSAQSCCETTTATACTKTCDPKNCTPEEMAICCPEMLTGAEKRKAKRLARKQAKLAKQKNNQLAAVNKKKEVLVD